MKLVTKLSSSLTLLMILGCRVPREEPKVLPMTSRSAALPAGIKSLSTEVELPLRYPSGLVVTNGYDLLASSNLVDWFVYPTNKYVHGVTDIWVTNEYPRMFFRVRVY